MGMSGIGDRGLCNYSLCPFLFCNYLVGKEIAGCFTCYTCIIYMCFAGVAKFLYLVFLTYMYEYVGQPMES